MVTERDLARLPYRAMVAFAVRCARRIRPLFKSPDPLEEEVLDAALAVAESFAKRRVAKDFSHKANHAAQAASEIAKAASGSPEKVDFSAAQAAAFAAQASAMAHNATRNSASDSEARQGRAVAISSAYYIYNIAATISPETAAGALDDLRRLLPVKPKQPGTLGSLIDPGERGPLGPLWPQGEPVWFRDSVGLESASPTAAPDASPVTFYFDITEFDDEEIAGILGRLSDLYRSLGGDALVIERTETLDPASVLEPEEV